LRRQSGELSAEDERLIRRQFEYLNRSRAKEKFQNNNDTHADSMGFSWLAPTSSSLFEYNEFQDRLETLHRYGDVPLRGEEDDHDDFYVRNRMTAMGAMFALGEEIDFEADSWPLRFRSARERGSFAGKVKLKDFKGPYQAQGFRELVSLGENTLQS